MKYAGYVEEHYSDSEECLPDLREAGIDKKPQTRADGAAALVPHFEEEARERMAEGQKRGGQKRHSSSGDDPTPEQGRDESSRSTAKAAKATGAGVGKPWETLRPYVEAVVGKQATALATVSPAAQGARTDLGTSGAECPKSDSRKDKLLRAILRAPAEVQDLYREGLISQKVAAKVHRQVTRQIETELYRKYSKTLSREYFYRTSVLICLVSLSGLEKSANLYYKCNTILLTAIGFIYVRSA